MLFKSQSTYWVNTQEGVSVTSNQFLQKQKQSFKVASCYSPKGVKGYMRL